MEKDIVKSYVRYLKLQRNMSPNTLDAYQHDLRKLLDYLEHEQKDARDVTLEDLEAFSAGLHDIGIHPRSQCRILSGVRAFFRFLQLDGYRDDDPTELLESPQIGEHLPEVLTTQEVDRLEASIDLSKWEGHRNRAIIEVLFSCGLRVSELVNLKLSNLYIEEEYVRVMGKGSKERLVPISQKAIQELKYWFDDRCHMTIKPGEEDYVFLNRYGKHLTRGDRPRLPALRRPSRPIPCATRLPQHFWREVPTCVSSRHCWVMRISARRKSTPTSTPQRSGGRFWNTTREILNPNKFGFSLDLHYLCTQIYKICHTYFHQNQYLRVIPTRWPTRYQTPFSTSFWLMTRRRAWPVRLL